MKGFGQIMRDHLMNHALNQDGVPLKDWPNSDAFKARMDAQFDAVFPSRTLPKTKSEMLATAARFSQGEWS